VEQHAHGHTGDIERPLSREQMADDRAEPLRQLPSDVPGYSTGGTMLIMVGMRHPDLVCWIGLPEAYAAVTPNTDAWPRSSTRSMRSKPASLAARLLPRISEFLNAAIRE